MSQKQPPKLDNLETSKMWKQATRLAEHARQLAEVIPHHEQFTIASPLAQHATTVTTDIAHAVGRGSNDAYDFRVARGRLFAVKSLILMAQQYELVGDVRVILNEANTLLNLVDTTIMQLESKPKAKES